MKKSKRQNLPSGRVTKAKTHADMEKYLEEHAEDLVEVDDPALKAELIKSAKAFVYLRGMAEVASDRAQETMEEAKCDYRIEIKYKFKDMDAWSSVVTVPMPPKLKRAAKRPGAKPSVRPK